MAQQAILAQQRRRHAQAAEANGFMTTQKGVNPRLTIIQALEENKDRLYELFDLWDEDRDGRLDEREFLVISGTAQTTRDLSYMRRVITRLGLGAVVTDVSSAYAVLGVMGPASRQVLGAAAPLDDLSDAGLPFGMSKQIGIGYATCRASRVTCASLSFRVISFEFFNSFFRYL